MTSDNAALYSANSAAAKGLALCHTCGKLSPIAIGACPRCRTTLHVRKPDSIQRTWALLLTAGVLYIPANVLPIMQTEIFGRVSDSTIFGGVVVLWEHGSYPVALVILIASVFIPLAKLFALVWLSFSVSRQHQTRPRERTVLYRLTELVGRWSMVDIFVVAILVALIQLGGLMSIHPGPASLAFAGVVVVTMFAAMSFDPRLIWDTLEGDA